MIGQGGEGLTVEAVLLAEPRNNVERVELSGYANDLAQIGRVRRLSEGQLVSYIVSLPVECAPLLDSLEITLKRNYRFGRVEMPLQPIVLSVIQDVVDATGGEYFPFEACGVCGATDYFAAPLMLPGEDGRIGPSEKVYCTNCARDMASSARKAKAAEVVTA